MKFISLFSGIGGFDLAFQRVGMECVSMCEIDKAAQGVLQRHFPTVKLYDDVKQIGEATHERGSVDLICGGFPCQDLSVAGKRAGLAGERSGLWFEFARIIDELEPRWVVIENVPGLLSSHGGRDFAKIIYWLAERGYGVTWRILDAQYFGLAQRRRRVFIVGHLGDGRAAEVLFESEGVSGDTPQGRETGKDIAYSIRANPSHSGDKGDGGINTTMIVEQNNVVSMPDMISLRSNPAQPVIFAQNSRDEVRLLGGDGRLVGSLSAQPDMKQQSYVAWDMYNFTDTGAKTGTLCGEGLKRQNRGFGIGVRRLTPTECERLQGLPDGWTENAFVHPSQKYIAKCSRKGDVVPEYVIQKQSDSIRYFQLGNAVAIPVVEWIAKRIKMAEKCQQ